MLKVSIVSELMLAYFIVNGACIKNEVSDSYRENQKYST